MQSVNERRVTAESLGAWEHLLCACSMFVIDFAFAVMTVIIVKLFSRKLLE